MSDDERRGWRDLTYNTWHRKRNLRRFVGMQAAHACSMVDVDGLEYCCWCYEPLALIETARQRGPKNATATARLARAAGIPAYRLLYEVDTTTEKRCGCGNLTDYGEITRFWLTRVWPAAFGGEQSLELSPAEWARCLFQLREDHYGACPRNPAAVDPSTFVSAEPTRDPKALLTGIGE